MAGLLGINGVLKPVSWSGYNIDDIKTSGFFLNMQSLTGAPYDYGTLVVFGMANTHIVQLYFAADINNSIYYRNNVGAKWISWRTL